jgi:hypothetical protein
MKEVTCIIKSRALTRGKKYPVLEKDEADRTVRVRGDDGRDRWSPMYCFDMTGDSHNLQPYTIWIEAEHWPPERWPPADDNTSVNVTFADGTRWYAWFFSYANIASQVAEDQETGECLSGKYVWATDMILVDEVSRPRIEEVVAHLIAEGTFDSVFDRLPDAEPDEDSQDSEV